MCVALLLSIAAAAEHAGIAAANFPDSTEGLPCPRSPGELKDSFTADYDKSVRPRIAERLRRLDLNSSFEKTKISPEEVLLASKVANLAEVSTRLRRFTLELVMVTMWVDPRLQYDSSCGSSAGTWDPITVCCCILALAPHPHLLSLSTPRPFNRPQSPCM